MTLLVGVLTLLVSGGAKGDTAAHCARLTVQSQAREHMVTGHGRRIVIIGDSYSVGLGLRRPEASWPSRLDGRVHVFGFSGSGFSTHASACTEVSYADRAPYALRNGAALVVVEGGLNDYDQPEPAVRRGFRTLMNTLRGRHVVVVGPPDAPSRKAAARRIDAILRQESARAHVRYIPTTGHKLTYLYDDLHLTPAGHRAFGDLVARAIKG